MSPAKPGAAKPSPESSAVAAAQLKGFIDKFEPKDRQRIRAIRAAMRKRFPAAHELVWDNYNFLVVAYAATLKPADVWFSIAADAHGVTLFFAHGATLADPDGLLQGTGSQIRFIRLASAERLSHPSVAALMIAAVAIGRAPPAASGKGSLVIRSVSPKQRPRRKTLA